MVDKPRDPKSEGPGPSCSEPGQRQAVEVTSGHTFDVNVPPLRKPDSRTALEVEEARRQLVGWSDEDLEQVPLLPAARGLDEGAMYVDLRDPARREFIATAGMHVPAGGLYVPKDQVRELLWNRILGVKMGERMGQAGRLSS